MISIEIHNRLTQETGRYTLAYLLSTTPCSLLLAMSDNATTALMKDLALRVESGRYGEWNWIIDWEDAALADFQNVCDYLGL